MVRDCRDLFRGAATVFVDANLPPRTLAAAVTLARRFDYVLIDSPPSLGLLTVNGLMAAESGVLVPVQCEYLALEGLTQLMQTLGRVRSGLFPELAIRGLVLTMFDGRTSLAQQVANDTGTQLVFVYSDSLGAAGEPGDTYLNFMKYNVNAIVNALK